MNRCTMAFAQAASAYRNSIWLRIAVNSPYDEADDFFTFGVDTRSWTQLVYADLSSSS
jgi:hypothetical protein